MVIAKTFSPILVETNDHRYYLRQAMQAYKEKKHAAYLENLQKAISLRPDHPTIMYNLAGAHALVGKRDEALAWLTKAAEMGLVYPAAADSDFVSIRDTREFHTLLEKFEANKTPINRSSTAFTIEEMGLITEGIAYDPQKDIFYVSSVHQRKIISIDRKGSAKDFSSEHDGLWSAMGIDGLYFHQANLIAIQNGVNPHRVLRLVLNKERSRVERTEVMEANHALFDEPTLGVIVQDMFFYIANSQWGSVDDEGKLAPLDKLRTPVVLKIKL